MDTYYLNNAVYLLEDFLRTTSTPFWGGSITYGPRQPHCWTGNGTLADRIRGIAEYIAARAPRGLDRPWWRGCAADFARALAPTPFFLTVRKTSY
jgi:hypothetical protein